MRLALFVLLALVAVLVLPCVWGLARDLAGALRDDPTAESARDATEDAKPLDAGEAGR